MASVFRGRSREASANGEAGSRPASSSGRASPWPPSSASAHSSASSTSASFAHQQQHAQQQQYAQQHQHAHQQYSSPLQDHHRQQTQLPSAASSYASTFGEYLAPFQTAVSQSLSTSHGASGNQYESTRLLADLAPHIMKPRILSAASTASHSVTSAVSSNALIGFLPIPLSLKMTGGSSGLSVSQPARNLVRIGQALRRGPVTSNDLVALEASHQILADAALSISSGHADDEEKLALVTNNGLVLHAAGPIGPDGGQVSLLRGFEATIPSARQGRERRRKERARDEPLMGLKQMGHQARGLLTDSPATNQDPDESIDSVASTSSPFASREKRKARQAMRSKHREVPLSEDALLRQDTEVRKEKDDVDVRRRLLHAEVAAVDLKIAALQDVKDGLQKSLTSLREEELELDDEQHGIDEQLQLQRRKMGMPGGGRVATQTGAQARKGGMEPVAQANAAGPSSSRRRRGPLFLPGEHDELPHKVAFMTLTGHSAPIGALDFSEPYGTLVSAGVEGDSSTRVWDLSSGVEIGRLRHDAMVKALQVEDDLCITGGVDSKVKIWDLKKVEDWEDLLEMKAAGQWDATTPRVSNGPRFGEGSEDSGLFGSVDRSIKQGEGGVDADEGPQREESDPQLRTLEGHSKEVTALYFDDTCLVTGASDKTLRQWDLNTGQCVLTMDILWAISNPTASQALGVTTPPSSPPSPDFSVNSSSFASPTPSPRRPNLRPSGLSTNTVSTLGGTSLSDWSGNFAYPTPPLCDGSWELYTDFVGSSAIQFWGYALASGSADGAVRMWDMRTGQSHRTLLGHTAPVTSLQFDEHHVVSASLDRSIRVWDLRSGGIVDTIRYDFPVSSLQFDSRKIVAAAGEKEIKVFNRTTLQHSSLAVNGHTKPAERLRYMDRYAASGGKDCVVKIWAL